MKANSNILLVCLLGSIILITANAPAEQDASPLMERLPPKIQKIQKELPAWIQNAGDQEKATALMRKMQEHLKARDFEAAEKTADTILKMMGLSGPAAVPEITEEVREKLAHNIGCSFLLFRTRVQEELKVTREQKEKLDRHLQTLLPEAMLVLPKNNGERGKYNRKTHEQSADALKGILTDGQRARLHQLELQKDLLFGPEWNMKELQITDEQHRQFIGPTQETQQRTQALMAEIQQGASPEVIRPKAFQLRLDLEVKLEALLTEAQKKQWKEMLGKPVDPGVIYGGL